MSDADETKLFRNATRDVKPLKVRVKAETRPPKPRAIAKFTRADQQAVLRESLVDGDPALLESGEEVTFRRAGVPETLLRKLRRGQFAISDELDLHGLTSPQARHALREFLSEQIQRGARCVRIVHGKGLGSGPRGPVLKNLVNRDLRRMAAVIAFGTARHVDGGGGAVLVLLDTSHS